MLSRRELLGGAVLGTAPRAAEAAGGQEGWSEEATRLLAEIRDDLRAEYARCGIRLCPSVERLRQLQRAHLKSDSRYPTFIDVGLDVWEEVHDWLVETRQPVLVGLQPDGQYTLTFGQTFLLLRPEGADDFIGYPYDTA